MNEININVEVMIRNCGITALEVLRKEGNSAVKNSIGLGLVIATSKP